MLVNYSIDTIDSSNASHYVTIVPRLDYSVNLLENIIGALQEKRIELKNANQYLVVDFDKDDQSHIKNIELEHLVVYSLVCSFIHRYTVTSLICTSYRLFLRKKLIDRPFDYTSWAFCRYFLTFV